MPIPKYDEMYRAVLDCLADGKAYDSREVKDAVARRFALSEQEQAELLPSGKKRLFADRIAWTSTYLKKAGLMQKPTRGVWQITPAGQEVLREDPPKIDNVYLNALPRFANLSLPWEREWPVLRPRWCLANRRRIFWTRRFCRSTPHWQRTCAMRS